MTEFDPNTNAAWLASTVRRKLNARALEEVDISATTDRVSNTRELQGLRVEGHLMYGVARLIAQKADLFSTKTEETRRDLERELDFHAGRIANEEPGSPELISQSQTLEMISSDFNLDRIVSEFRPTQSQQDVDDDNFDFPSPDTELRNDEEPDDALRAEENDSFAEPDMMNAGDEEVLRNILGLESQSQSVDVEMQEPELELEPEPSHEAVTSEPEYEPEETVESEVIQPKKKRTSRKRLCPVDDQINIARNTRAPSHIITSEIEHRGPQRDDEDDFFDPARIAEIIKRRKLASNEDQEIPVELPDLAYSDPADASIAGVSMDGLMDLQDDSPVLDYGNADQEEPEQLDDIGATQLIGSLVEDENLEELMAQEIRAARQTIKEVKNTNFSAIHAATKRSRAALFSEMLALATLGELSISQSEPYAEIRLTAV